MVPKITLDTHSLIWFVDKDLRKKLSSNALKAIREATETGIVYIPTIVLIELLDIIEKGRVNLSFDIFMLTIHGSENYKIVPFDVDLLEFAIPLKELEIHDRLILATAMLTNSVLISKDRMLNARNTNIKVLW
jgi:PIN domain nuclease of toxin-antitoxin system